MKKVFAIIAILVVLVGAVFANDTNAVNGSATITVKTAVSRFIPIFQLRGKLGADTFTSNTTADAAAATGTEVITDGIQTYTDAIYNTNDTGAVKAFNGSVVDATDIDISVDDVTVNFGIFQTNLANVDATYTLTYTAGYFTRVATSEGTYVAAGSTNAYTVNEGGNVGTAATDVIQPSVITGVQPTAEGVKYTVGAATGANAGGITVKYTGRVDASTAPGILLGTFNVKWLHDVNAKDGEYRADVVLTVTGQ